MLIVHHHSDIFWDIEIHIGCSALDLYLVPWFHVSYLDGDVVDSSVEFEYISLKSGEIDDMGSEKIFDIEKLKIFIVWKSEIDIASIILEDVPVWLFVEFEIADIRVFAWGNNEIPIWISCSFNRRFVAALDVRVSD